jgi:hypothetical protein
MDAGTEQRGHEQAAELEQIRRLEELWNAPPASEPRPRPAWPRRAGRAAVERLGWALAVGWVALVTASAMAPAPAADVVTPLWVDWVLAGFLLSLGVAGMTGLARLRIAFGASALAGAFGVALSISCKTTGHHGGSWWLYELGATAALTALSFACLARPRRS